MAQMKVQWERAIDGDRKIQIGDASWRLDREAADLAGGDRSVRAYYRNARGGFRSTSPQISLRDLALMIQFAAEKEEFSIDECSAMIEALRNSHERRRPHNK